MRRLRFLLGVAALLLLGAAPGYTAERLEMSCPVCDHVDVSGHGLEPDATLTLVIQDVRTGLLVAGGLLLLTTRRRPGSTTA